MNVSKINISTFSILFARSVVPLLLLAELYLHILVIAPVVYGIGPLYFVYLSILMFVVANIVGNVCSFVWTDTSIKTDPRSKREMNVKLCTLCDRNVPPRLVF